MFWEEGDEVWLGNGEDSMDFEIWVDFCFVKLRLFGQREKYKKGFEGRKENGQICEKIVVFFLVFNRFGFYFEEGM